MPDQMAAYLYVADAEDDRAQPDNVFFRAASVASAMSLCKIFASAYPAQKDRIRSDAAAAISLERQILLDEALAGLEMYDDPDPGIYDPPPARATLRRAEWARRARGWESQIPKHHSPSTATAPNTSALQPSAALDPSLAKLLGALEWHRLLFLLSADACRRNPHATSSFGRGVETVEREDILGWKRMMEEADQNENFLWDNRHVINRYADAAVEAFGPGDGLRPSVLDGTGKCVPLKDGTLPYWSLHEWGVDQLEESSDSILAACRAVAVADEHSQVTELVRTCMNLARPEDHSKWTPRIVVRWNYLARLDAQIRRSKEARVEAALRSPEVDKQATTPPSARPDPQQLAALEEIRAIRNVLMRTMHEYPDAVPTSDYHELLGDLTALFHRLLASSGFENLQQTTSAPPMAEADPSQRFVMLMTAMMSHPALEKALNSQEETIHAIDKAWTPCQESASQVSVLAARLAKIMVIACRTPTSPDVKDFRDPARFRHMLSLYWNVARELVQTQTHTHVGFSPHPLLPLIENLRDRIATCFSHLFEMKDAPDTARSCDELLAVLTEGEAGDLSAVPEWADGEVQKIDRFIAHAGLRLGARAFPLTAAEEYFIKFVAGLADEHKKRVNDAWRRLLADADAKGPAATEQAKRDEAPSQAVPTPAVVPAVVLGRPGDPCTVNGVEIPSLTDAQYAVMAALIAAADDGLTKDALEAIRPSARRILADLQQRKGWADVIQMAGTTNGRYRIRL